MQGGDLVTTRHALVSIGEAWNELYNKEIHGDVEAIVDPHDGHMRVTGRVHWIIKKVHLK